MHETHQRVFFTHETPKVILKAVGQAGSCLSYASEERDRMLVMTLQGS